MPCHKHILAAASPAFAAMVENKHREAIEGKANIKLSAVVGQTFVKYIYTGEVEEALLKEHSLAFLALGDMYNIHELKDLAEKELLIQMKKDTMVEMISIGELLRADQLFEAALKFTKANMSWLRSQVC